MKLYLFFLCLLFHQIQIQAQPISGYVKNSSLQGLEDKLVEVYMTINGSYVIGSDLTASNGYFVTGTYTDVEDEQSQIEGIVYTAGSNSANIEINTTSSSNVIIKLFDITGQEVYRYQGENTGKKIYSLPIKQFANALYISSVTVNGRTDVNKILSIDDKLYFGKTSSLIKKNNLNKKSLASTLDSIIVSGDAIKRTTFTYNLSISGSYSVGNLLVDSNYVNLTLNVIKLMEWKQSNNQLINATVNVSGIEKTTDANGQAIFEHLPSGRNNLIITHPETYQRETILRLENDSTHTEYILDTLNFTSPMMDMYNDIFGRIWPGYGYKTNRWTEPPIFYIVADTTQEPGYYVISWEDISPYGGLTYVNNDTSTGKIIYSQTRYNQLAIPVDMEYLTIHELSSGMSMVGRRIAGIIATERIHNSGMDRSPFPTYGNKWTFLL